MTAVLRWRHALAALLFAGIVLLALPAVTATNPVCFAYDAVLRCTATTLIETRPSARPERSDLPEYIYDGVPGGNDDTLTRWVNEGTRDLDAYEDALNLAEWCEVTEGAIYDGPAPTIAAEAGVTVTQDGLAAVTEHLAQFGEHAPNQAMLERLGGQVGSAVTGADANFYTHELLEAGHMASGMSYEAAHAAALEQAGVSPFSLYHPEVIQQFPAEFNNAWRAFWGL